MVKLIALVATLAVGGGGVGTASAGPAPEQKIRMLQVSHGLSFAPSYIARGKGYFQEEGIALDFKIVGGERVAQPALMANEAEAIVTSSNGFVTMASKELQVLAVQGTVNSLTTNLTMSPRFLKERKVSRQSPLAERLAALRGARLSGGTVGSALHRYIIWIVKQGGLDPERDVTLTFIAGGPPQMAALKAGHVDGFLLSPPSGEQAEADGYGQVFIHAVEIPEFKTFVHEVVAVRREYAREQASTVDRIVRAMSRGNNFLIERPEEAKQVLQPFFPHISPRIMSVSVDAIKETIARDGRMTEAEWRNVVRILMESGAIPRPVETREGVWWTNAHIKGIPPVR
ncbi:MAG: ABC transporter substrate-binding protein [Deltaproteobacteria bacterium]|nr:ABC transporter substrate-binding protein [Deltaproteobacteria bacterium]